MSETILTAENLKFRYDSEQPGYALNGVSMQVKRGEFVAVLGANGCGKSTLAKHFNAILLPEEGKVYVEDMDTADDGKLYDIRQTVGMVFQSPDNQIVATVVEEDVAFALENLGVPPEEMRRRVDDAMKMAGIYEFRSAHPTTSRAARSSASPLRASSPCVPTVSSSTRPPPCSTLAAGSR